MIKVQFIILHKIFQTSHVRMKHQVQQVETLNKYAVCIHTLCCYKASFTLPQVKALISQS